MFSEKLSKCFSHDNTGNKKFAKNFSHITNRWSIYPAQNMVNLLSRAVFL